MKQDNVSGLSALFPDKSKEKFEAVGSATIKDKAADIFKAKTYLERFRPHYSFANGAGYVFQLIAALCAFPLAQGVFRDLLPDFGTATVVLSVIIGLAVVAGLEAAKRLFFGDFIKRTVTGQGFGVGPLFGNIILLAISVYMATAGASDFAKERADKSGSIKANASAVVDSINAHYSALDSVERAELSAFRKSVMWKGKIDASNKNVAGTIRAANERLSGLADEKRAALETAKNERGEALSTNGEKVGRDSNAVFWFALAVEFAGLFCIGFVFFYLSRVFIEQGAAAVIALDADDGRAVAAKSITAAAVDLGGEVKKAVEAALAAAMPARPVANQIGFHRSQPVEHETKGDEKTASKPTGGLVPVAVAELPTLKKDAPNGLTAGEVEAMLARYLGGSGHAKGSAEFLALGDFLRKYANVVAALENGASTKGAATGCGVSESTVQNVKRCLKTLNAAGG